MNDTYVGFTGSQKGMTARQLGEFSDHLVEAEDQGFDTFAHGDCVGADAQAHAVAYELGFRIVIHPPIITTKRAYCGIDSDGNVMDRVTILTPYPYLDRNQDIVLSSAYLIATPGEITEKLRSGTWSTVRFARKHNKNVVLITP